MKLFGQETIRHRIATLARPAALSDMKVVQESVPAWRFVDFMRGLEAFWAERPAAIVDSSHAMTLSGVFWSSTGFLRRHSEELFNQSTRLAFEVAPGERAYFPAGRFWVASGDRRGLIARLQYDSRFETATLEMASADEARAEDCLKEVVRLAGERSVYRNQTLRLAVESERRDEYGDVEKPERVVLTFYGEAAVDTDNFVIEDELRAILKRNVVDLHQRREALGPVGVPARRGVLLYGPPGTGKTYACRYLAGLLSDATALFVTGAALAKVSSIFTVARLFSPCVVFLEDADLVFAARDLNMNNAVLAELLDQLDGLRANDEITVVVTTNSLDRIEGAIKDRPGRISQCVYMGPPNGRMRMKYLDSFLKGFDVAALDLSQLVRDCDGATQAFMREWVTRAVQISTEDGTGRPLLQDDFEAAMAEMKRYSSDFGAKVIGFRALAD